MSERNIEQMMEMLRESGEIRQDLEQKSEEIQDNLRQKRIDEFLMVLAAIKQSPDFVRRKYLVGKYKVDKDPVYEKLYALAKESLDPAEYAYFIEMVLYLEKSADIFSDCYNKDCGLDLKSIFQALIDREVVLPTVKEFTAFKSRNWNWPEWDWCVVPGQLDLKSIMSVFDKKLDSIHAKYQEQVDREWGNPVSDERPNRYYMIAVDKIRNATSRSTYQAAASMETYQRLLKEEEDWMWEGTSDHGRAKLRGLTQVEYAALTIEDIYQQMIVNEKLPLDVSVRDGIGKAVLLGTKLISVEEFNGFITASWNGNNRTFCFGDDNTNGVNYSPRLSMGFDGFNKEPNE